MYFGTSWESSSLWLTISCLKKLLYHHIKNYFNFFYWPCTPHLWRLGDFGSLLNLFKLLGDTFKFMLYANTVSSYENILAPVYLYYLFLFLFKSSFSFLIQVVNLLLLEYSLFIADSDLDVVWSFFVSGPDFHDSVLID